VHLYLRLGQAARADRDVRTALDRLDQPLRVLNGCGQVCVCEQHAVRLGLQHAPPDRVPLSPVRLVHQDRERHAVADRLAHPFRRPVAAPVVNHDEVDTPTLTLDVGEDLLEAASL